MAKRRRRAPGLLLRLGQGIDAWGRWALRHPQPVILFGLVLLTGWALWGYLRRADAFRIAHVSFPPQSSFTLREPLIGTNLWALDIRALSLDLKRQQPWLKEVRVVRQLPNAIRIEPVQRVPVAQVRIDRWYPVDREGYLLPEGRVEPAERLVRLVGLERAEMVPRAGRADTDERLKLSLRVLETLRRASLPILRRLTELNVADPQQIRFLIDGETEVRCGSESELDAHLQRLRAALKAIATQSLDVRYIDVRFQEPVIGPRA